MSALDLISSGRLLHKGGEACIYEVQSGSRKCMLKWYNRGCGFEKKILDDLSQKRVPGAYRVLESSVKDTHAYLLYENVEGICSKDLLPMPVLVALRSMRQLTRTLTALQDLGISHGDLNPANVVFGPDLAPVLIDFGIVGPGALAFAAPERFQGKPADVKSDLYSLGMLLFSWIAGESLVKANGYDEFAKAASEIDSVSPVEILYGMENPSHRDALPPATLKALEPLWKGLLRRDPDNRVEDFEELDELLEIALREIGAGPVVESLSMDSFASVVRKKMEEGEVKDQNASRDGEKRELPFRLAGETGKKCPKWVPFGVALGIVLLLGCIYLVLSNPATDIDGTGTEIIQKSRNMEKAVPAMLGDSSDASDEDGVKKLLQELPIPMGDSSDGMAEP